MAREIDSIYQSNHSMDDLDLQSVLRLFRTKTKASVWLEKNPAKARKIKTKFKKFWGKEF